MLEDKTIELALLDVNLGSDPIALELEAGKTPFAFATGYGNTIVFAKVFLRASVIQKSDDEASIAATFVA